MIFKIEKETLLDRIQKVLKIDILKEKLTSITTFFENVQMPIINKIRKWQDSDNLSSERYNEFLSATERDIRLIRYAQKEIKDNIVADWNIVEQIKEIIDENESIFDINFITEFPIASQFVEITSGVESKVSKINVLKVNPSVSAHTNHDKILPFHGKKYGMWIPSEITSEDGIRPEIRDESVLVDNKDSFYEVEAVALQDVYNDVIYAQEVIDDEIRLTVTVKMVFSSPQSINYIVVKPYNSASGMYYKLTDIVLSDGTRQEAVDFNDILMIDETTITFDSSFDTITAMYLTFQQEKGYFIKYTVGHFMFRDNNYLIDVTGDGLTEKAIDYKDPVAYIEWRMNNIEKWILDIWKPDMSYNELPQLNTSLSDSGFKMIDSRESRRKRWVIGIEDIDVGENIYHDRSEIVTNLIDIPAGTKAIQISADTNNLGEILYYFSFDNGLKWHLINPIGSPEILENFRIVPETLFINSDKSEKRQLGTKSGKQAFIRTDSTKLRMRAVLIIDDEGNIPSIKEIKPVFLFHE